jgi:outer membrane lipoprotein-sorting protein
VAARTAFAAAILALGFIAAPAFAGQSESEASIERAASKIETVTRQAGQAGDNGDQSFNMAGERLASARAALKSNNYDTAEMLADEASLLADLTGEKATLAALIVSHDNLVRSTSAPAPAL